MRWLRYLPVLLLTSCSSSKTSTGDASAITGEISPTKLLRSFHDASAISLDQFRNVYVAESSTNTIIKLSPTGDSLRAVSGYGTGHYQFNGPVAIDARLTNAVFIADDFNHRIEQYTKDLNYVSTLYTRENTDGSQRFGYPRSVAADDAGNIYVADGENKRIIKARPNYSIERTIGGYAEATRPEAVLTNPTDLAVDRDGHVLILDNAGTSIAEFDNLGNPLSKVSLGTTGVSIAATNDTIFVLVPTENSLLLFHTPGLQPRGKWVILRGEVQDTSPLSGFATRSGIVYLLSRQGVYACRLRPVVSDTLNSH